MGAGKLERAQVFGTSGSAPVLHQKKRCQSRACGAYHGHNYVRKDGVNYNTAEGFSDFGEAVMVSGKVGFSVLYMRQFFARTFRNTGSFSGEGDALSDVAEELAVPLGVKPTTFRMDLGNALFYVIRVKDIESGVEHRFKKRQPYRFDISKPLASSPLYCGESRDFVIFDARRDDTSFNLSAVRAVVSDGNHKTTRKLTPVEEAERNKFGKKPVGRPRMTMEEKQSNKLIARQRSSTSAKKRPAGATILKKRPASAGAACHEKKERINCKRTAGLYLTMDGASTPSQTQRIIELREMLHSENNEVREKSLLSVKDSCPRLCLWVHDYVCKSVFADTIVKKKMLDALHVKTHTGKRCRTEFNPRWGSNPAMLKRLCVTNTVICEQAWRLFNSHLQARYMSRHNYRVFFDIFV